MPRRVGRKVWVVQSTFFFVKYYVLCSPLHMCLISHVIILYSSTTTLSVLRTLPEEFRGTQYIQKDECSNQGSPCIIVRILPLQKEHPHPSLILQLHLSLSPSLRALGPLTWPRNPTWVSPMCLWMISPNAIPNAQSHLTQTPL